MSELRAATWPAHQRLEKRIDFKQRLASAESYRAHIERMWGFYAALELRLECSELRVWLADYDSRHKTPLLMDDLVALGATPTQLAALPRCLDLPPCDEPESAFGCAYVLEGATLGGRALLPTVQTRLDLTASHGAAFLASYGTAVSAMWSSFSSALEAYCATEQRRRTAAEAASATFTALEIWLCGAAA